MTEPQQAAPDSPQPILQGSVSAECDAPTQAQHMDQQRPNETLATELHFELLKQYAWLSSAICGGLVLLIQTKLIEAGKDVYIALAIFGLSVLSSILGQDYMVDSLLKGKNVFQVAKQLARIRFFSVFAIGIGSGYLVAGLFLFT
ncbi:hypothetical protein ACFO3I_07415 [Rheinheimera marina]|uniref:Uncharacterized protein n=1 Tax=Rheinheimera marina TaxID=1774958 RepID=A0ABV9JKQ9_9GAMM